MTWTSEYRVPNAWISLGRGGYVRASEVVAVVAPAGFVPQQPHVRAVVVLRNRTTLAAFVGAATVMRRLREVTA